MSLGWIIYLAGLVDNINSILNGVSILLGCAIVAMAFLCGCDEHYKDIVKPHLLRCIKVFIVFVVLLIPIPTSNTIYLILGVNMTEKVVESEVYNDAIDIIGLKLKDIKQELLKGEEK